MENVKGEIMSGKFILEDILHSLHKFDWLSFQYAKVRIYELCNWINHFLIHGRQFNEIFPPIMVLQSIDLLPESITYLKICKHDIT